MIDPFYDFLLCVVGPFVIMALLWFVPIVVGRILFRKHN
jgi:hypothetical protein